MKLNKNILKKVFLPHFLVILMLTVLCSYGLSYIFLNHLEETIPAYLLYTCSAYTLSALVFTFIYHSLRIKRNLDNYRFIQKIREIPFVIHYSQDLQYRKYISLYNGLLVSIAYVMLKGIHGYFTASSWDMAIAFYYAMLSVIRINLIFVFLQSNKVDDAYLKQTNEWKGYRNTGYLMFILNVAMSGMSIQMIWQNKSYVYPGYMIYISALYTFYTFISAFYNFIKYRKSDSPTLSAMNTIRFSGAFMSMFTLQTAMITQFGSDDTFKQVMNIITGTCVMILVFAMALWTVLYGRNNLRKIKDSCLSENSGESK